MLGHALMADGIHCPLARFAACHKDFANQWDDYVIAVCWPLRHSSFMAGWVKKLGVAKVCVRQAGRSGVLRR
jgi:hypothetical protein